MSNAIENVLQIVHPDNGNVVILTTFQSSEEELEEKRKKTLTNVTTLEETSVIMESENSFVYVPHYVVSKKNIPDTFKHFVDNDLESWGDSETYILMRFFEQLDDGTYRPIEIELGDGSRIREFRS